MNKTDKIALARRILQACDLLKKKEVAPRLCFVGFDGFTDEILSVVDKRKDCNNFTEIPLIEKFGQLILQASGKSCNVELISKQKKIGGNAPILTEALLQGGHRIAFAGSIGTQGNIEPLFVSMANLCEKVYPLSPSGQSQALEFQDGKIILGKLDSLYQVTEEKIVHTIGKENLISLFEDCDLFASVNWTMLPAMTKFWKYLSNELFPQIPSLSSKKKFRWMFVDLADPAKRSDEDIKEALETLQALKPYFSVILGLNEAEALRIVKVLYKDMKGGNLHNIEKITQAIHSHSKLDQICVHATAFASVATSQECASVYGPYCTKPLLSTGAGDNFNAGYCNGLLYQRSVAESLLLGVATSGYYVRKGKSPSVEELSHFLVDWDKGAI